MSLSIRHVGRATARLFAAEGATVAIGDVDVAGWLARLGNVWVEGELSELKRTDRWGLVYFCLKDDEAILQAARNGVGIAGVSWGARIMPIKVLSAEGRPRRISPKIEVFRWKDPVGRNEPRPGCCSSSQAARWS